VVGPSRKTARRYAQALFDLAAETGQQAAVRADVAALSRLIEDSPELTAFLAAHWLSARARSQTVEALFAGRLQPLTLRFVRFLDAKRRLALLGQVCVSFRDCDERSQGVLRGRLTAPFGMDAAEVATIQARLSARIRAEIRLTEDTDPQLLGGFRVQVVDTVYDLSLAARLRMMQAAWIQG
jgi:F-type H+-transporting ATPase subunit delta